MNSRVNDAYHTHNTKVHQEQVFLLKQYKILVIVFLITFELYICGFNMYFIYEYVYILKNVRNNWITEKTKELSFKEGGIEYLAG